MLCFANTLKETIANLQATIESLNETITQLQATVGLQNETNVQLQATIDLLNETVKQKEIVIESQQEQVSYLKKQLFGTRSEKTIYVDAAQGKLFPSAKEAEKQVEAATDTEADAKPVHVPAHDRKAKRSQEEKYANLPP